MIFRVVLSQGVGRVAAMERTGVLNGSGGLAAGEVGCPNGSDVDSGSSVLSLLEVACEALRAVSLEGFQCTTKWK